MVVSLALRLPACVFDSDGKRTWQLNYVLSTHFLFYLGDGNPFCERPLGLNSWRVVFVAVPAVLPILLVNKVCFMWCSLPSKQKITLVSEMNKIKI